VMSKGTCVSWSPLLTSLLLLLVTSSLVLSSLASDDQPQNPHYVDGEHNPTYKHEGENQENELVSPAIVSARITALAG